MNDKENETYEYLRFIQQAVPSSVKFEVMVEVEIKVGVQLLFRVGGSGWVGGGRIN